MAEGALVGDAGAALGLLVQNEIAPSNLVEAFVVKPSVLTQRRGDRARERVALQLEGHQGAHFTEGRRYNAHETVVLQEQARQARHGSDAGGQGARHADAR